MVNFIIISAVASWQRCIFLFLEINITTYLFPCAKPANNDNNSVIKDKIMWPYQLDHLPYSKEIFPRTISSQFSYSHDIWCVPALPGFTFSGLPKSKNKLWSAKHVHRPSWHERSCTKLKLKFSEEIWIKPYYLIPRTLISRPQWGSVKAHPRQSHTDQIVRVVS